MAPLLLEGNSLAEKHKNYNKLLKSKLEHKVKLDPTDLNSGKDELETLLKIDVASKERDVEYILEVLKCEDMLYVSYALKKCIWLIEDPQYAHIIKPDYLRTNLLPQMTAKASSKLWKCIRLHLNDEKRAEEFYTKENDANIAVKWLPNCSSNFIEANVSKHSDNLQYRLAKRICEKSKNAITNIVSSNYSYNNKQYLEKASFLITQNPEKYLDLVEKDDYCRPYFGKRTTSKLLKKFSDRILNKIDVYADCVHFPTFVRYLKNLPSSNIEQLLCKMYENKNNVWRLFHNFENVKLLINALPKEDRFTFISEVFLEIQHTMIDEDKMSPNYSVRPVYFGIKLYIPTYKFYEFAPYEIAFVELLKLYHGNCEETGKTDKRGILSTLVTCAKRNTRHTSSLLKHYRENHVKDERLLKIHFVEEIITQTNFHRFDESTWNILEGLFNDVGFYTDENPPKTFIEAIIVYKVLHDVPVPDTIMKKFEFGSLQNYRKKLNNKEQQKLFNFAYNLKISELNLQSISNEKYFEKAVVILNQTMALLSAWNKDLKEFPEVIEKVKSFVEEKEKNSWQKTDLQMLYQHNSAWRKIFFEESFALSPCEDVAVNALKHNSELLMKNKPLLDMLNIPLVNVIRKLRVYWCETLAKQWLESYLNRLSETESHKIVIRDLYALLPREPLLEMVEKNSPKQAAIDWDNINETELSLQRYLAKYMHFARPQPPPKAILPYARGDYLQYALPSLLAIFYNMKLILVREFIPQLLDAPVSLQKHGIRLVFQKLSTEDLLQSFSNMWKISKNASIRTVLFSYTYDMLCKEKDPSRILRIWQIMIPFMDNFTFEEDKRIYELMEVEKVMKVPSDIRPEYFVKSYKFMKLLIPRLPKSDQSDFEYSLDRFIHKMRDIIQLLPLEFVVGVLSEYTYEKFAETQIDEGIILTLSAHLFSVQNEEGQLQRYNSILLPIIRCCISKCIESDDEKKALIKMNLANLLNCFRRDLKYVIKNKFLIPVNMYTNIFNEISKLPIEENYLFLTTWKLTVELAKNIKNYNRPDGFLVDQYIVCEKSASDFGNVCLRHLKEDIKMHFSDIYLLFVRCFQVMLNMFSQRAKLAVYKSILSDNEFIEAYLMILTLCPVHEIPFEEERATVEETKKLLVAHPSVEVQMNYFHKFKKEKKSI